MRLPTTVAGESYVCDGRFRLDDRILGEAGDGLWRGYDTRLERDVSLRIVPPTNQHIDSLRAAACRAARVDDARVARVIDVLDANGSLVIVSEWIVGTNLEQALNHETSVGWAVRVVRDITAILSAMHAKGQSHGRLRPAAVIVTEDGEVMLRGHGVDAALWGTSPGHDPVTADISAVGSLLMACLTGRWASETPANLPPAPLVSGRWPEPGQLRAEVPGSLDTIVARCRAAVPTPRSSSETRPYSTIEQVFIDLEHLATVDPGPTELVSPPRQRKPLSTASFMRRSALIVVLAGVAIASLMVSARIFIEDPANTATTVQSAVLQDSAALPSAPANSDESKVVAVTDYRIPILRAWEVVDAKRNTTASVARVAIDRDPASSWTITRESASGHPATGIIIDLGTPRPMKAIKFGLIGNNTDLSIYATNRLREDPSRFRLVSEVVGAPGEMTLRQPKAVTGRYFFISLTKLPQQGERFTGGISSIQVFGG